MRLSPRCAFAARRRAGGALAWAHGELGPPSGMFRFPARDKTSRVTIAPPARLVLAENQALRPAIGVETGIPGNFRMRVEGGIWQMTRARSVPRRMGRNGALRAFWSCAPPM